MAAPDDLVTCLREDNDMNLRAKLLKMAKAGCGVLAVVCCGMAMGQVTPGTVRGTTPAVAQDSGPTSSAGDQAAPVRQTLVPAAAHYIVHPGDVIDVTFRFTPEFNDEVTVGPDGRVTLKSLGDTRMAGYTVPEIQRAIVNGAKDTLVDPEVTVSLKDYERPHVVVAGEVQAPGKFELRKPTTALQAILLAGGPKDDSAMGRVIVFRKVNDEFAEVHVLKLDHYKGKTMSQTDMLLQPDDMVLVQHDKAETFGRYIKLINLGFYLNPLQGGIF
jgi:polysaccharide export outer membrane protein